MTIPKDANQKIEAYLAKLRAQFRSFNDQQVAEIVAELRSHILDKLEIAGDATPSQVDAILAALGTPEELAGQYITDNVLARAEVSRSPLRILASLFRWASLSVAGLWLLHDATGDSEFSFRMGFGTVPAGRDLLGWWIVPLGLLAGCALVTVTTRLALWCARQYRKSGVLPRS